jgi:hypothetical protein
LVLGVLVVALLVPFLHPGVGVKGVCEWFGGAWASDAFRCITRSCHQAGTCGSRYCPACNCPALAPGAALADVYVRLGDPTWIKGNRLVWPAGAASDGYVVATVDGGRLAAIDCSATTRP